MLLGSVRKLKKTVSVKYTAIKARKPRWQRGMNVPDVAWDLVADIFTTNQRTGRPRADDRLMLNGPLGALLWRSLARYDRAIRSLVNDLSTVPGMA